MPTARLAAAALCSAALLTAPAAQAGAVTPHYDHVVIVVEENHSHTDVVGAPAAPFINSLAAGGALMTNSFAIGHPSQPNYLALFAGDTFGVDSNACPLQLGSAPNLASELISAGATFGAYAEDLPAAGSPVCQAGKYVRKHAPWTNFANIPPGTAVPFTALPAGPALPTVSFVIPNQDNNMHDGSVATADAWLASRLSGYAAWAKANNSLLIVTWDEDDDNERNRIPTILYGAHIRPGSYGQPITHYSVLATLQDIYRLPRTARTTDAAPIGGVWEVD